MDSLFIKGMIMKENAKEKISNVFHKEDGAVDIVAIIILIAIAIVIAIAFKKQLANLVNSMMGKVANNGNKAINDMNID